MSRISESQITLKKNNQRLFEGREIQEITLTFISGNDGEFIIVFKEKEPIVRPARGSKHARAMFENLTKICADIVNDDEIY